MKIPVWFWFIPFGLIAYILYTRSQTPAAAAPVVISGGLQPTPSATNPLPGLSSLTNGTASAYQALQTAALLAAQQNGAFQGAQPPASDAGGD